MISFCGGFVSDKKERNTQFPGESDPYNNTKNKLIQTSKLCNTSALHIPKTGEPHILFSSADEDDDSNNKPQASRAEIGPTFNETESQNNLAEYVSQPDYTGNNNREISPVGFPLGRYNRKSNFIVKSMCRYLIFFRVLSLDIFSITSRLEAGKSMLQDG